MNILKANLLNPDSEHQQLEILNGHREFVSSYKDKDGDVEFYMDDGERTITFHLDQTRIKMLIDHLQKQIL